MALKDAPAHTLMFIGVVPVAGEAVPEEPDNETPILQTEGKVTNDDGVYQTLASWTVPSGKMGVLSSIELAGDAIGKCHFRVTFKGVVQETGWELPGAWTGYLVNARLVDGDVILLEGKSNDGTAVSLWGTIEAREIG